MRGGGVYLSVYLSIYLSIYKCIICMYVCMYVRTNCMLGGLPLQWEVLEVPVPPWLHQHHFSLVHPVYRCPPADLTCLEDPATHNTHKDNLTLYYVSHRRGHSPFYLVYHRLLPDLGPPFVGKGEARREMEETGEGEKRKQQKRRDKRMGRREGRYE